MLVVDEKQDKFMRLSEVHASRQEADNIFEQLGVNDLESVELGGLAWHACMAKKLIIVGQPESIEGFNNGVDLPGCSILLSLPVMDKQADHIEGCIQLEISSDLCPPSMLDHDDPY